MKKVRSSIPTTAMAVVCVFAGCAFAQAQAEAGAFREFQANGNPQGQTIQRTDAAGAEWHPVVANRPGTSR